MKRHFPFIALALFLTCCKGSTPSGGDPNPNNTTPINFELAGIQDVQMLQTDTVEMVVELQKLTGSPENVSLGVNNLVNNYVVSFTPSIDTPSYFSTMRIITQGADTGWKTFQVVATGTKLSKPYNLNIHVSPDPSNPALAFPGTYKEEGLCINDTPNHFVTVAVVPGEPGKIKITGLWVGGNTYTVKATLDETNHTVTIPTQTSSSVVFNGNGTYSGTTMQLSYNVTAPFVTEACNVTLTKQ